MSYHYSEKDKQKLMEAANLTEISKKHGISYCTAENPLYPTELLSIKSIPPLLYYKGDISILNKANSLAIVGSRKASSEGLNLAYHAGKIVGESALNLVNGLALGCDTEALRGALSAGGKCVAILPCGLDQIQPASNQDLAEEILKKGGCLISEYPIGTSPQKHNYVERDRLQSGVSKGVLIVEAAENSGTMHTARYALQQAKRLACYSHALAQYTAGNLALENSGKAQTIKNDSDLTELINALAQESQFQQIKLNLV